MADKLSCICLTLLKREMHFKFITFDYIFSNLQNLYNISKFTFRVLLCTRKQFHKLRLSYELEWVFAFCYQLSIYPSKRLRRRKLDQKKPRVHFKFWVINFLSTTSLCCNRSRITNEKLAIFIRFNFVTGNGELYSKRMLTCFEF